MKKIAVAAMMMGSLVVAAGAQARDVGAELNLGTTGLGVHFVTPIADAVNGRVGFNAFNYNYSTSASNVNYDFKLKAQTVDLLADWYPMQGSFHVTGGLIINGNKLKLRAKPDGNQSYTLNGHVYTTQQAGAVVGKADFRSTAPYLGIGFGNVMTNAAGGWGFTSDFGVIFQGSPNTTLTNEGCTADAQTCARLASDLVAENAQLRDKVKSFNLYPVLRVGVSYRF